MKRQFEKKRFRLVIVTKKSLRRIYFAVAAVTAIAAAVVCAVSLPSAVPAFSDETGQAIIDSGMPTNGDGTDIGEILSAILGFDKNDPESIIESSSGIYSHSAPSADDIASSAAPNTDTETVETTDTDNSVQPYSDDAPAVPESDDSDLPDLKISNATGYNVNLNDLRSEPLNITLEKGTPNVLIMHTHTTECYVGDEMSGESERTTDDTKNVCAVGDAIANTLNDLGIETIHDTTIHDYPTYKGAYGRALETIESSITANSGIKIVLDVHRDAYIYNDGTKLSVTTDINGEPTAQVMLVLGTDSMGLYHPYWRENLILAAKIQNAAEIMYPGLMRPLNLRRERFNMHVTTGSLLIEVGANGNTLDEAVRGGKYFAQALAEVLTD